MLEKLTRNTTDLRASCATVQGESHDFHQVTNKRDPMCFAHIEKLLEGDHNGKKSLIRWSIEKIYSVQSSQLFAGSSGDSIHTEVNCHCGKRLNYKETFAFSTDKKNICPVASAI